MGGQRLRERQVASELDEGRLVSLDADRPRPRSLDEPAALLARPALQLGRHRQSGLVERHQALVVELAKRHLEEMIATVIVAHAVPGEPPQLTDAQTGAAHQVQTESDGRVRLLESLLQLLVHLWRQRPRQIIGLLRQVARADQLAARSREHTLLPEPVEISAQADEPTDAVGGRSQAGHALERPAKMPVVGAHRLVISRLRGMWPMRRGCAPDRATAPSSIPTRLSAIRHACARSSRAPGRHRDQQPWHAS